MRILYKDLKKGLVRVAPISVDDLFLLYQTIEKGDLVTARSERKIEVGERKEKVRKKVKITLRAKEVDLKRWVNVLRISGEVVEAPEEIPRGAHHSFNVEQGKVITIEKEKWKGYQLKRLEEAKIKEPTVLVVALDDDRAGFGIVRRFRLESLGEIRSYVSGKREGDRKKKLREYFGRLSKRVRGRGEEVDKIILAGPGFTKDNFSKFLFEKYPSLEGKTVVESVSYGGGEGVREALRRKFIQKILKESRIAKEIGITNKFFKKLSKTPNFVKYSLNEVKKVAGYGAVKTLLVTDGLLRKKKAVVEKIIEEVQKKKGKFYVVSTEHEGGKRLEKMGGIGAILRYKM